MMFEIYVFTYKEPIEMIEKCIESINKSMTHFNNHKIFLLSTNTEDVDKCIKKFKNVAILRSKKKGKWRAVNLMIKNVGKRTDFVICIDSDSTIDKRAIEVISKAMKRKNVGIVASVPKITCNSFKENVFRVSQEIAIYRSIKRQEERGYCGAMVESIWALKKKILKRMPSKWVNEGDWFSRICMENKMIQIIDKNLFYDTKPIASFTEMIKVKRRIVGGGKKHGGMGIKGEWSQLSRFKETMEFMLGHPGDAPYIIVAMFLDATVYISLALMPPKKEWYTAPSTKRI